MSGLLESLVERALGRAETLRPAPRARFEGDRGALNFDADEGFEEENEERVTEPRTEPVEARPPAGPLKSAENRERPAKLPSETLLPRKDAPAVFAQAERASSEWKKSDNELGSQEPISRENLTQKPKPETPPSRVEKTRETHKETRVERETRLREVELLPEAREPVEPRSPIAAAFEKAQATPADTKAPGVTLSIGRIEVRPPAQPPQAAARSATPAPTVRRTPSAKPRQSLGEYLAKRRS